MSNLLPAKTQRQSFAQSVGQIWLSMIKPHPSIKAVGEFRRARLLAMLSLILSILLASTVFIRPRNPEPLVILGIVSAVSYILSRTKYYQMGIYVFTYALTAVGYINIYRGTASSIAIAITTTVHVSLIVSSVLLSQKGFIGLVVLAAAATYTAPYYSNSPIMEGENHDITSAMVFVTGVILYGIQVHRANLEKEGLKEITDTNRELEDVKASLEQRIESRTLELEKANQQLEETSKQAQQRAARMQVISEISQEISSSTEQELQELLDRTARIISEKLDFYHVGVFLLDENREYAVLRAANSRGGQRMLERRHQLKVGGAGIVGYVSQGGRPRIALDTGLDAVFFNNPDLPETRSEMAIPLKYGLQVIGALDIQSTVPAAFKEEDADLISTLANQLAIAVNDVLTREQSGFNNPNRMARHAKKTSPRKGQSGYSYSADGTISAATTVSNPVLERALATGETMQAQPSKDSPSTLAVPVKFRDQVIGIIHIEAAETGRKWTEDEITVVQSISERAAFALENARLFEQTRQRAEQEETIARIASQISASTDFSHILQTTIEELGRTLGATRTFIQLETPAADDEVVPQTVTD